MTLKLIVTKLKRNFVFSYKISHISDLRDYVLREAIKELCYAQGLKTETLGLVFKGLDSQSRGSLFKTTGKLQG